MKDNVIIAEMLRAHNVTAEEKLNKLLNKIWEKYNF